MLCLRRREEEGAVAGVPPVSLCVLIEVFLPLNPPVIPPPCWLEESGGVWGVGGWVWQRFHMRLCCRWHDARLWLPLYAAHVFINTEIVRHDEKEGCCVVLLLALVLEEGGNRRANVSNDVPVKTLQRDHFKISKLDLDDDWLVFLSRWRCAVI